MPTTRQRHTLIAKYRDRNYCIQSVIFGAVFTDFFTMINVTNPLDQPIPKAVLARESLLMDVSSVGVSVPTFPRIIWHGYLDEVVPFSDEQKFVTQQCEHGANIQFQVLHLADHILGEFTTIDTTITSLDQIFSFTTPNVTCGESPSTFSNIFGSKAPAAVHNSTVDSLKSKTKDSIYYKTNQTTTTDLEQNVRRRKPSRFDVH
jgi:hypothetical protein